MLYIELHIIQNYIMMAYAAKLNSVPTEPWQHHDHYDNNYDHGVCHSMHDNCTVCWAILHQQYSLSYWYNIIMNWQNRLNAVFPANQQLTDHTDDMIVTVTWQSYSTLCIFLLCHWSQYWALTWFQWKFCHCNVT